MSTILQQLIDANTAYSQGIPYLTDEEYDILWQQVYALDPYNKHLYHTSKNPSTSNFIHMFKIKGVKKAFNSTDLLPFFHRFGDTTIILEPKYDGCAAMLYKKVSGYSLVLTGDGEQGRDVSQHLNKLNLSWVPSAINSVEICFKISNWKKEYGSNPRNTVAGWLNKYTFPYYNVVDIISHSKPILFEEYNYDGNIEKLTEKLLYLYHLWKEQYPIDGIMLKVKNPSLRITTDTNPNVYAWSIAWKPPIQIKKTKVTDIEWNVSRTGKIIPTVIYEPVELCGTINSRATGNNAQWIIDKQISKKSIITIGKAGEIIPQILSVQRTIDSLLPAKPKYCPICKNELIQEGVHCVCNSDKCIAKLIKSLHFFYSHKAMNLKSLGKAKIASILKNKNLYNLLKKNPWALLIPEFYKISNELKNILGEKHYNNYKTSLIQINNKKNICHFISGLGYEQLGYQTAIKMYHIMKGTAKNITKISDIAINNYLRAYAKVINFSKLTQEFKFKPITLQPLYNYCITGKLSVSRSDMIQYLEKYNWQFSSGVSNFISFLIVGEKPGKLKLLRAKELNILQITEEDLPKYIKGDKNDTRRF